MSELSKMWERNIKICREYGSGNTTLKAIGIKYNLTRERVRQIIGKIKRMMRLKCTTGMCKGNDVFLENIDKLKDLIPHTPYPRTHAKISIEFQKKHLKKM